jgi:hypothetical protein
MRHVAVVIAAVATFGTGCSSSSNNFLCCFDVNGAMSYWQCPNQAAYDACCGGSASQGCLTGNPAASACTNNGNPNDCP